MQLMVHDNNDVNNHDDDDDDDDDDDPDYDNAEDEDATRTWQPSNTRYKSSLDLWNYYHIHPPLPHPPYTCNLWRPFWLTCLGELLTEQK